jgi:hypothetical protein
MLLVVFFDVICCIFYVLYAIGYIFLMCSMLLIVLFVVLYSTV